MMIMGQTSQKIEDIRSHFVIHENAYEYLVVGGGIFKHVYILCVALLDVSGGASRLVCYLIALFLLGVLLLLTSSCICYKHCEIYN